MRTLVLLGFFHVKKSVNIILKLNYAVMILYVNFAQFAGYSYHIKIGAAS